MKIDRIYIAGYKRDLRYTRCCVASIRRWYPSTPISLLKDEGKGAYDTTELEKYWSVDLFPTACRSFGWGMSKLEPLFLPKGERCLIIDSDTVFVGRVLDGLEGFDEDFVVNGWGGRENLERYFFDPGRLAAWDPSFRLQDQSFSSGQFVASSGLLKREDFAAVLEFSEPRRHLHPDIFHTGGSQGILSYVVLKKVQAGELSLRAHPFMWVPQLVGQDLIAPAMLNDDSPHPFIIHWAVSKRPLFRLMPRADLLRHFEAAYYQRIRFGRTRRLGRTVQAGLGGVGHRLTRYARRVRR